MGDLTSFFRDTSVQILALIFGLIFYKRLNLFTKLLLLQVVLSLLNFGVGKMVMYYAESTANQIAYVFYTFIEVCIILYAAYELIGKLQLKKYLYGSIIFILISYLIQISITGLYTLPVYAYCISSIIIAVVYIYILFISTNNKNKSRNTYAVIFVSIGIVVSFACMAPYMALFNYLNAIDIQTSKTLYRWILINCSDFRYVSYIIGFIIIDKQGLEKTNIELP